MGGVIMTPPMFTDVSIKKVSHNRKLIQDLVRMMMDNHHFPINNKIARYVLAVQCIGQVKFGLKMKDHSNHYHHLLQYQQVDTTAVLL